MWWENQFGWGHGAMLSAKRTRQIMIVLGLLDLGVVVTWAPHVPKLARSLHTRPWSGTTCLLVVVSLAVSAYGLIRGRQWALVVNCVQFPFRIWFRIFSFGWLFLLVLPRSPSVEAYRAVWISALVLEALRAGLTILMSRPRLMLTAWFCLATANLVPAFWLAGDIMYGFQATYFGFYALRSTERGQVPGALFGIIANFGFLAVFIAALLGWHKLAKLIAVTAATSAFASVAFLATGSESFVPHLGCLLWLATGVLLVRASWAVVSTEQQGAEPDCEC